MSVYVAPAVKLVCIVIAMTTWLLGTQSRDTRHCNYSGDTRSIISYHQKLAQVCCIKHFDASSCIFLVTETFKTQPANQTAQFCFLKICMNLLAQVSGLSHMVGYPILERVTPIT